METFVVTCFLGTVLFHVALPRKIFSARSVPVLGRVACASQYLTLYAQGLLCLSFYWPDTFTFAAKAIGLLVFVLYHGFALFDPTLLSYDSPDIVRKATAYLPPIRTPLLLIPWFGLHFQHTLCPLWYVFIQPTSIAPDANQVRGLLVLYMCWNELCWTVLGVPAYPVQRLLRDRILHARSICYIHVTGVHFTLLLIYGTSPSVVLFRAKRIYCSDD